MYKVICLVFLNLFLEKQNQACKALNKNFGIKEMKTDHLPGEGKVAAKKEKKKKKRRGGLGAESPKCR